MKQKFIGYIKENHLFSPGATLVAGISGGADSLCLLHLLCEIRKEWNLSLTAVHVNHGIRGEEACEDAAYVQQIAEQWQVPFFLVERDVPRIAKEQGKTQEEIGRELRYEIFQQIAEEQHADRVVVAHHMDDQAETLLFHLIRGSGVQGLKGMLPKRGTIVRPLLGFTRKEIENYLCQQDIAYRQDSTNDDISYARNYIRKQLIPEMQHINPKTSRHLAELASDVQRWCEYMEHQVEMVAHRLIQKGEGEKAFLDIPLILKEEDVIQDEVLKCLVSRVLGSTKDVTRWHYAQMKALLQKESGKKINLPMNYVVSREYSQLVVKPKQKEETFFYQECDLPSVNIVKVNGQNSCIRMEVVDRWELPQEIPQKDYTKWFDYDKIKGGLVLRNPQEGDYFVLDKQGHRKKLSRYFIDEKIPAAERKEMLLLAEGNRVLWVIPHRIDAGYKITEKTKRVLVVTKERVQDERRS